MFADCVCPFGPASAPTGGDKKRVDQGHMFIKSRKYLSAATVAAVAVSFFSGGVSVFAAPDGMQDPVDYPHAGVSIALPEGFKADLVPDPVMVMRAALVKGKQAAQAVTVSAFCVAGKAAASEFADFSDNALKAQLSVRKFKTVRSIPITVAGIKGVLRLLKYTYDGDPTTAARVYFIRQLKDEGAGICYMLNVEVGVKHESKLTGTLGKLIKGFKLIEVQSPASIPVRLSAHKLANHRGGFSIRTPQGWFGSAVRGGVTTGQKNYLIGGADSPQIAILTASVKPDASSETFAKMVVSKYLQAAADPDSGVKLVSKGPAKVGARDAYQYVMRITIKDAPATRPVKGKPDADKTGIQAVRVVCRTDSSGKSVRAYLLTLACQEDEAKFVTPWLDAIGEGFEFLPLPDAAKKPAKPKPPRS